MDIVGVGVSNTVTNEFVSMRTPKRPSGGRNEAFILMCKKIGFAWSLSSHFYLPYLMFAGEDALLIVNAFDKRVSGGVQIPVEDIFG